MAATNQSARYSFWSLFKFTGIVGIGLALFRVLGLPCALYYGLLIALGYASAFLPRRVQVVVVAISVTIAVSPFLGVAGYTFIIPGTEILLPTIEFPPLQVVAYPFYAVGEFVLSLVANLGGWGFRELVFFHRSHAVRPFMVVVLWTGITVTMATPLVISWIRGHWERRSERAVPSEGTADGKVRA